jgi:Asp-tRNA(Asn)/Glu-tRNA(Gln) amidotransferase A subunit family amidase
VTAYPAGLAALASVLRAGDLSPLDLLDELAARFDELEPALAAVLPEEGRFERLRRESRDLLARFPNPAKRPPLFGVPVGIKDVFRVDGFPTRGGSRLPAAELAGPEASCVGLLRSAGALILGKTVSTEFAYFAPGPTRNPVHPEHTPGGSSSGSAAAVAAGLCPLALGTQTIGSITRPAAYCGVVGFKPSWGRIPADGLIPLAPSLDHVGFFTPDAAGATLAASVLCEDWRGVADSATRPRLGVPVGPYLDHATPEGLAGFQAACRRLARAGYEIVEVPAFADFDAVVERHRLLVAAEAAEVHAGWFARHRELYERRTVELIERGQAAGAADVERARSGREKLRQELTALLDQHGLDLWISPAAPGTAPRGLDSTGDPILNLPWSQAGLPTLGLPLGGGAPLPAGGREMGEGSGVRARGGDHDGVTSLPLGLQIAARFEADEELLAWGEELERALLNRPLESALREAS